MPASNLTRLLALLRPYPWLLPMLVTLGIAASLSEAIGIGLLIPLLGTVLQPSDPATQSAVERIVRSVATDESGQIRWALVSGTIFVLILAKTLIVSTNVYLAAAMNGRIAKRLRVSLWERLIHAEMAWFSRSDHGRILSVIDNQTYRATEALGSLNALLVSACTVLVFGIFLFLLSVPMALIIVAAGAPIFLLVRSLTGRAKEYGYGLAQAYAGLAGRIVELLAALKTVRVFNQEDAETARFVSAADSLRRSYLRTEAITNLIGPVLELLYLPVFLVVIGYALMQDVSIAVVLAFLLLLYRAQAPLKRLDAARVELAACLPSLVEMDWLLVSAPDERARNGTRASAGMKRRLVVEQVRFSYPGTDKRVLDDVSIELARGEVVALIGPSGAGKSTLMNLLFGLYMPDSGRIIVDDEPLAELDAHSWRRHLAFAGQDSELLTGSVRYNIAYGCPGASMSDIEAAAKAAYAHDFIIALPEGYETDVATRGGRLSGGQRQRIALARALLRKPDLLALDEATNAVDTATELAIRSTISALAGNTTILIIAHRTSTLASVDRVIVIEAGRIVDQGAPHEVRSKDSLLAQAGPPAGT